MDALAAEGYAQLVDTMEQMRMDTPVERLHRIGHAYIAFALANRPLYSLMFQYGSSPKNRYGKHNTRHDAAVRTFELLVETVRQVGEIENVPFPEDSEAAILAAGVFWAHVHGAISLLITGHGGPFAGMQSQFCRQSVETAVAGLLARIKTTSHTDNERETL